MKTDNDAIRETMVVSPVFLTRMAEMGKVKWSQRPGNSGKSS
jgi:hypothetical protein